MNKQINPRNHILQQLQNRVYCFSYITRSPMTRHISQEQQLSTVLQEASFPISQLCYLWCVGFCPQVVSDCCFSCLHFCILGKKKGKKKSVQQCLHLFLFYASFRKKNDKFSPMTTSLSQQTYSYVFCIKIQFHGTQVTRKFGRLKRKEEKSSKRLFVK